MVTEDTWKTIYVCGICFMVCLGFCAIYIFYYNPYQQQPKNPQYINHIIGLNLVNLQSGNYTFDLQIKNPYENTSIRVYSFLFTDPEDLENYVTFDSSVKNGTLFTPLQQKNATIDLSIPDNPYPNAEYYVRVGCYRLGVDY